MRALRLWLSLIRLSEWQALAITSLVILLQMAGVKALSSRRMVSTEVSRKALHIGTGLLFILCWPLFPNTNEAPYWAAALPALITLRFLLIGLGVVRDPDTVRSMARWGGARELLKGPLLYGLVFVTSTIAFWRAHPAGITSLVLLCAGDGCVHCVVMCLSAQFVRGVTRSNRARSVSCVCLCVCLSGLCPHLSSQIRRTVWRRPAPPVEPRQVMARPHRLRRRLRRIQLRLHVALR